MDSGWNMFLAENAMVNAAEAETFSGVWQKSGLQIRCGIGIGTGKGDGKACPAVMNLPLLYPHPEKLAQFDEKKDIVFFRAMV